MAPCAVIVVEIGAGEDEVGFGTGLQGERGGGLTAGLGEFVFEQQGVGESGEGAGICRLLGERFAELVFGLAGGAVGEELAGAFEVERGALGGLGFADGCIDGILQLDGELAVGALVIIALDAGVGRDGGDARRRGEAGGSRRDAAGARLAASDSWNWRASVSSGRRLRVSRSWRWAPVMSPLR